MKEIFIYTVKFVLITSYILSAFYQQIAATMANPLVWYTPKICIHIFNLKPVRNIKYSVLLVLLATFLSPPMVIARNF